MSLRALTIAAALLLQAAISSQARIIVDAEVPDQPAESNIHVSGSNDSSIIPAGDGQDTIAFLNQDHLHGSLLGIDGTNGVHWQNQEAHDSIQFKLGQLAEIKLSPAKPAGSTANANMVTLTNGDQIPGNIVSLDDKSLNLDTWYAGRLTIARAMIRRIIPLSNGSSSIYEGPTSLDGWSVGHVGVGRSWIYRDGALIGNNFGTIGRDMKLPDISSISFDLVLRGNSQLSIGIYSDRPDNFGNCYMLVMSPIFIEMQRYSRNGGNSDLGNTQIQNAMRHDKTHIEVLTDKQKKSFWLLIDDKLVKEWNDTAEFNGGGGNVVFSCQPNTYVKLSNIKVEKWDGKFDDSGPQSNPADQDFVQLANQDKVSGTLESIQDGKAKLASSYAELSIPIERLSEVDFSSAHTEQARPEPSDIRADLPDGGSVTFSLDHMDVKGLFGTSLNFAGQIVFTPGAITRIEFNLPAQQQLQDSQQDTLETEGVDAPEN
jgi:hypothetical protein